MLDRMLYSSARMQHLAGNLFDRTHAEVANGRVAVGEYVRELPANHIQPCDCCLCRPRGGERPLMRVQGIGERNGVVYLQLDHDYECPADEVERVVVS